MFGSIVHKKGTDNGSHSSSSSSDSLVELHATHGKNGMTSGRGQATNC
jgi:hypothetical protein